jgi:hypothetical protein
MESLHLRVIPALPADKAIPEQERAPPEGRRSERRNGRKQERSGQRQRKKAGEPAFVVKFAEAACL